ncbi:MAG: YgfZ/GcvT domain-containing protein [Roseibacillus sp.]
MSDLIPLHGLTHLRFRGPDAERYLNGQVTQQVTGIKEGQSRYTFVCDAKGRILFDGTIHRDAEGFLLSVEGRSTDDVLARMDRYLIADDCELTDESEIWLLLHEPSQSDAADGLVNRFGTFGRDLYQATSAVEKATNQAKDLTSQSTQEALRIAKGVPRTIDLLGSLPAETGLEDLAVSFHKGCYLGQEVISRMKRAGKTNRKLIPLSLDQPTSNLPLTFSIPGEEKTLLEVTSVSNKKTEHGYPALGYLSSRYPEGAELKSSEGISAVALSLKQ